MSTATKFDALAHEPAMIARIEASRERIISARQSYNPAVEKHDDAEAHLAQVENLIYNADESVSVNDLVEAQAGVRFAELGKQGAERRAKAVKNKPMPTVDKRLAEAVSHSVEESLKGRIKVVPTYGVPRATEVPASEYPLCYTGMTTNGTPRDSGGALGGRVEVLLVRDGLTRPLDEKSIESIMRNHGFELDSVSSVITTELPNGAEADMLELDVGRCWVTDPDSLPVIAELKPNLGVALAVAGIGSNSRVIGGTVTRNGQGYDGPSFSAWDGNTRVVSESVDADGVRTATVEHAVRVEASRSGAAEVEPGQPSSPVEAIERHVLDGASFVWGVGRVESIDTGRTSQGTYTVRIVAKSQAV